MGSVTRKFCPQCKHPFGNVGEPDSQMHESTVVSCPRCGLSIQIGWGDIEDSWAGAAMGWVAPRLAVLVVPAVWSLYWITRQPSLKMFWVRMVLALVAIVFPTFIGGYAIATIIAYRITHGKNNIRLAASIREFNGNYLRSFCVTASCLVALVLIFFVLIPLLTENNGFLYPLHSAAVKGQKDETALLLGRKADVNAKDERGRTPLHYAAWKGHKDVAELLLANKADVNAKDEKGSTPLHLAVIVDGEEMVELLLANKADMNAEDSEGRTPLYFAAQKGFKGVAELLLANNADVNAKGDNAGTPFMAAHCSGHDDLTELLRRHGGHD